MSRYLLLPLLLATATFSFADPVNLVVNGGFETGDLTGWSLTGNTQDADFVGSADAPGWFPAIQYGGHTGSYAFEIGNGGGDAMLSQTITTTGNGTFDVSFWLASQAYGTPSNDFKVLWGSQTLMSGVNLPAFGYKEYNFSGLTAAGASTVLEFEFQNNPSWFTLDDVSVVDPPSLPEPGAMAGLAIALAGLVAFRLRRAERSLVS